MYGTIYDKVWSIEFELAKCESFPLKVFDLNVLDL